MAILTRNNIVTNGLVLNLDSLNPQSLPVDPTVNQYANSDFANNTGSWTFNSWTLPSHSYSVETVPGPFGTNIPVLKITKLGAGGAADFHQANTGKYYSGSQYTLSAYISGSGSFVGSTQWGFATAFTLSGSWQRVSYTVTAPNNTQYPFWAASNLPVNTPLYFTFAQSENLQYASPYISGSRTSWVDLSGNNNTATLRTGSISSSIPQYKYLNERVLTFDGTGSYAVLTRPVQDDFTLSCWFRTTQGGGVPTQWYNGRGLIDCEMSGYQNDFGLAIGGGRVIFGVGNPNLPNDISIYSSQTYNDGRWHQAVATRIKSTGIITLYIDSILTATGIGQTGSLTTAPNMRIGSLQTGLNYFSGNIGPVHVYNRALSQAEIIQNYNATKTRFDLT